MSSTPDDFFDVRAHIQVEGSRPVSNARLVVQLQDTSLQDAPAKNMGQVEYSGIEHNADAQYAMTPKFGLSAAGARRRSFTLSAALYAEDGSLQYITTESYPIDADKGDQDITLVLKDVNA